MTERPATQDDVPQGFRPAPEVIKIVRENPGAHILAIAYDCTGEEVDSIWEAHTVVVRVYKDKELIYEMQVAGSPCGA